MAKPLPNTNKLDFTKNRNSEPEAPKTPMPDGMKKHEDGCRRQAEKSVLAIITKSPPARNSQTISFSVMAVESPSTRNTTHSSLSFLIEVLINFIAERA